MIAATTLRAYPTPNRLARSTGVAYGSKIQSHANARMSTGRVVTDRSHRRGVRRAVYSCAMIAVVALAACTADPGYKGRSSAQWIEALGDPDPLDRADAASALGNILRLQPKLPNVVRALVDALADTSDIVRSAAGLALATDRVKAPAAIPGLLAALGDSAHPRMRQQAAYVLGLFGTTAAGAVPSLAAALSDTDAGVRAASAEALGRVGPDAGLAMPELERVSRDPEPGVRLKAVEAVLNIRPPTWQSRPFFMRALADSDAVVRAAAAYSLGALKAEAAPAIPRLIELLSDSDVYVRRAAVFALGEIGPPAAASLGKLREVARTDSNEVVGSEALGAAARIEGRPIPDSPPREPTKAEICAANRRAPGC